MQPPIFKLTFDQTWKLRDVYDNNCKKNKNVFVTSKSSNDKQSRLFSITITVIFLN